MLPFPGITRNYDNRYTRKDANEVITAGWTHNAPLTVNGNLNLGDDDPLRIGSGGDSTLKHISSTGKLDLDIDALGAGVEMDVHGRVNLDVDQANADARALSVRQDYAQTDSTGRTIASVNVDQNYEHDGGSIFGGHEINGVRIDQDYTHTSGNLIAAIIGLNVTHDFSFPGTGFASLTSQLIKLTQTGPAGVALAGSPLTLSASQGGNYVDGALRVDATAGGTGQNVASSFRGISTSSSAPASAPVAGFQGQANGNGTFTGTLVGAWAYLLNGGAAAGAIGLLGHITSLGMSGLTADKKVGAKAYSGAIFGAASSLFMTSQAGGFTGTMADMTSPTPTHIALTSQAGDGWFAGDLEVDGTIYSDGGITMADAADVALGTTIGTKFATAAGQRLGFWGVTPVVQPSHIADADGTLSDITSKFNTLLAQLATIGLQAAS